MSTYGTYPEHGIGMILNYGETVELIKAVNIAEDEMLHDKYDLDDSNLIPRNIVCLDGLTWFKIQHCDGTFYEDDVYNGIIVTTANKMSPFKAAYKNVNEIIDEMKECVGKYLPDNFDYEKHIVMFEIILTD